MSKEKHLEMIQGTVGRLASNSYAYKGWALTVTAALVAFMADKSKHLIIYAIYPVLAFWALDSFNLALERAFRSLFEKVRNGDIANFDMRIADLRRPIVDQLDAMMAIHMLLFYGTMIAFVLVAYGTIE